MFHQTVAHINTSIHELELRTGHTGTGGAQVHWYLLMWSFPAACVNTSLSCLPLQMNEYGFGRNDRGNCIITFSEVAVDNFLSANGLELMFRAHQEKSDGLKLSKSAKCLTIFSSSNYQGHGNGAGVVYVGSSGKIKLILKDPS